MQVVSILLGIVCILYGILVFCYAGFSVKFHFIWIIGGIVFVVAGILLYQEKMGKIVISDRILKIGKGVVIAGGIIFLSVEVMLASGAFHKPDAKVPYMIILGCQVRGSKISEALYLRLDAAEKYLKKNPDTKVIVSGGQGPGEDISEAQAMKKYLQEHGIAPERIQKEETSANTVENIQFSKKRLPSPTVPVVIVTNGFHVFRAVHICKKQGLTAAQGLAGKTDITMLPAYYLREFFAVIKDFFKGNLA